MKKIILFMLVVIGAFHSVTVYAHYHPAYLRSISEFKTINENWMSKLKQDTRLSQLSIPGTHDSISNGPGGDIVQTQGLSLEEQLKVGIRFIDIRARVIDDVLAIHHGSVYLNQNFGDVLNTIKKFLNKQPTEVIYMRLKQEYSSVDQSQFTKIFKKCADDPNYQSLFYKGNDPNPTVQATRGKIVLMYDGFYPSMGIDYNNAYIQDEYKLNTNWDLYDKWLAVKEQLNQANKDAGKFIHINYLSGSVGAFPYFVASGHSSPGSSAPRLATGLTYPGWADWYPDFPRVNWLAGIATIAFEGTNILTAEYIQKQKLRHVGIVVADFPGEDLINKIIHANPNYFEDNRPIPDGTYQIKSYLDSNKVISLKGKEEHRQAVIRDNQRSGNQKWTFRYDVNMKAYQIFTNDGSNEILAWNRYGNSNQVFGTPNCYYTEHYWIVERFDQAYRIRNVGDTNLVLDVDGYYPKQDTKIKVNLAHPDLSPQRFAQEFRLSYID